MKYDELEFDILLKIKQLGKLIADSADFQLLTEEFDEDTFRDWIMDIKHQLDRLYEEEEEEEND